MINGDDLFGAADLAALGRTPAGVMCQEVAEPRKYRHRLPQARRHARQARRETRSGRPAARQHRRLLFPRGVRLQISLSPRGEYEITDFVSQLAVRGPFHVIRSTFWYPIGTEEAWNEAQTLDLTRVMTP